MWKVLTEFRLALAFLCLLALLPTLAQQSESIRAAGLDVLSIDGPKPKDVLAVAVGDGAAWILTKDRLAKMDAITGAWSAVPVPPVKTWSWDFSNATIAAGSLWVTGKVNKVQGVHRIDLKTGQLTSSITIRYPSQTVGGDTALWIFSGGRNGTLFRIDPQTNTSSRSIQPGKEFGQPQFADGSLWVINPDNGTVRRFDPESTKMLDEFSVARPHEHGFLTNFVYYFAVHNGDVWVNEASGEKSFLTRIDATTHRRIAEVRVDNSEFAPVFWNGFVWLSTDSVFNIIKVDPRTNHIAGQITVPAAQGPVATVPFLFADKDTLWAVRKVGYTIYGHLTIQRIRIAAAETKQ